MPERIPYTIEKAFPTSEAEQALAAERERRAGEEKRRRRVERITKERTPQIEDMTPRVLKHIYATNPDFGNMGSKEKQDVVRGILESGTKMTDPDELEAFTYELAREIAENAPLSLRGTKFALYKIGEHPILSREEEEEISSLFVQSLQSEDMEEGKRAFMEKRKPRFKGR